MKEWFREFGGYCKSPAKPGSVENHIWWILSLISMPSEDVLEVRGQKLCRGWNLVGAITAGTTNGFSFCGFRILPPLTVRPIR